MIKIEVKYKEKQNALGCHAFTRIIKYKHPNNFFKVKLEQELSNTFYESTESYMREVDHVLSNRKVEAQKAREIVLRDVKKSELHCPERKKRIENSSWETTITISGEWSSE